MAPANPGPSWTRPSILAAALLALALLGWIGWWIGGHEQRPVTARPALWHIVKADREAWLFGTIHAVPRGEAWLSPAIEDALGRSDRLYLEVTGLEEERRNPAIFEKLGHAEGLPKIEDRLGPEDARRFSLIAAAHPAAMRGLNGYKDWAAALLINAGASSGLSLSSDEAGEAVLSRRFADAGKPIHGLETIAGQLSLFDRLDAKDQRLLLSQAVRDAGNAPTLYEALHSAWANADLACLEREFIVPLAQSPGLRQALIDERNARWAQIIDSDLTRQSGAAFIAVGAGHLLGPASLQARLKQLGWRIERIQ